MHKKSIKNTFNFSSNSLQLFIKIFIDKTINAIGNNWNFDVLMRKINTGIDIIDNLMLELIALEFDFILEVIEK